MRRDANELQGRRPRHSAGRRSCFDYRPIEALGQAVRIAPQGLFLTVAEQADPLSGRLQDEIQFVGHVRIAESDAV